MQNLLQDIRYSVRILAKSPGFLATAVLTLALGIGANTAIFSAINSVLLRPLPFADPDRLVQLYETEAAPGLYPFTGPDYLDWQEQNRTLEAMSLYNWGRRCNVSGTGEPQSAITVGTQANFFSVLGAAPFLGRTFAEGEDREGSNRVAVLSYGFWRRYFGGDGAVAGKAVELNSEKYTVVGVMPSWFDYPRRTEIWTPLDISPQSLGARGSHSYRAIGRLKAGVTIDQALADLSVIAKRLEEQYPDSNEKVGAAVVSMRDDLTKSSREPLLILLGAVALVLLVACANVANLLLIRAGGRRREIAVRSALGAGRWRMVRQLLTESILLSFAGAAAGLAVAWWCTRLLQTARVLPVTFVNPVRIDFAVLLFTLATAVLTGLLFGIAPALQASSAGLSEELKASGHNVFGPAGRKRTLRDAIAVAEIALSLALLVGAGLLLRSLDRLRHADIGIRSRNLLTMGIDLPGVRYDTAAARREFLDRLLSRVRSSPGVDAVSISTEIPLEGGSNGYVTVPGQDDAALRNQLFEWNYVSADYFSTFGVPLHQGRSFTAQDVNLTAESARRIDEMFASPEPPREIRKDLSLVAVVSSSMARMIWADQDPVGRTFIRGGIIPVTVIGVVGDVKVWGIRNDGIPQAYFPFTGALGRPAGWNLTLKTAAAPMTLLKTVRGEINDLDPTLAAILPRTMDDVVSGATANTTRQTWLLSVFAGLAVLLAAVGLYSVMAFLVAQRSHEIGIRMALGARRADLLRIVFGHAARLIGVGLVAGLGMAYWLTALIRSYLFGVAAGDPLTIAAVSLLLIIVGFAACCIPARRAMRVDPIVALRFD